MSGESHPLPPGHAHAPAGDDRPGDDHSSPSGHGPVPVPGQRRRGWRCGVGRGWGEPHLANLPVFSERSGPRRLEIEVMRNPESREIATLYDLNPLSPLDLWDIV